MRKIATILTLAIFLISLMPFSIADHMDEDKSIEDSREDRLNRAEEQEKEKAKAAKITKEEILKERKFKELGKGHLEKFKELAGD